MGDREENNHPRHKSLQPGRIVYSSNERSLDPTSKSPQMDQGNCSPTPLIEKGIFTNLIRSGGILDAVQ